MATKSATDEKKKAAGCLCCGWSVAGELELRITEAGSVVIECLNPWACWQRQIDLGERYGLSSAS